jgi:hypothetical protein
MRSPRATKVVARGVVENAENSARLRRQLHCRPAAPLCFCAASLAALREEIDQQTRHFDPRHAPGRPNAFSNQIILEIK